LGIDRDRGAQIDERLLKAGRPHGHPPIDIAGMPALERAQHLPVLGEIDVVRDASRIVDIDDVVHGMPPQILRVSNAGFCPVPYRLRAPSSPTALGRWKIQFCQAERRAKIFDSIVSGPPKRRLASRPVSASAEKLARSSRKTRISSSQSMSSTAKVTRPSFSAASASSISPIAPLARSSAAGSAREPLPRRGIRFDIG